MEKTMGKGQVATLLGITLKTLQRLEHERRLVPLARTTDNRHRYVHFFSSRLCGMRNYHRQLRAALESNHAAGAPDQD